MKKWTVGVFFLPCLALADQTVLSVEAPKAKQNFQYGSFQLNSDRTTVSELCLLNGASWLKPAPLTPAHCATNNQNIVVLPDRVGEVYAPANDSPFAVIRHLGVDDTTWPLVKAAYSNPDLPPTDTYKELSLSYGITAYPTVLRWHFDSSKLPAPLHYGVPNSGIHTQVGQVLSQDVPVFDGTNSSMLFQTHLNLISFTKIDSSATDAANVFSGITYAVNLLTKDVNGNNVTLTLTVNLFNPYATLAYKDYVSSDGNTAFASSYLQSTAVYIIPVSNTMKNTAWNSNELFAFSINRDTLSRMVSDLNAKRAAAKSPLLDTNVDLFRFKGATIRNESRYLEYGVVNLTIELQDLFVSRQ